MQQQRQGSQIAAGPAIGLDVTTALTRSSLEAASDFNRELGKFVSDRLAKDADLQAELARCTCPFATFDCMARFWQIALGDYTTAAKAMQALAATAAQRSIGTVEAALHPEPAPVLD